MLDNEVLVDETENTEETVEETLERDTQENGKFYTDEEFNRRVNEIADRRVARQMRKYEKEMAKYKDTENVLKSQIGGENIDEVNKNLRDLYAKDGATLPEVYQFENEDDMKTLGYDDAQKIIDEGFDSMEEEANRLASIGYNNLNAREKVEFTTLAEKLNYLKDEQELLGIGASKELLEDKKFVDFRKNFKNDVSIKEIYDIYTSKNEKVDSPGSLSNGSSETKKTVYTEEEISKLSYDDLKNDEVWEAVRRSMTG